MSVERDMNLFVNLWQALLIMVNECIARSQGLYWLLFCREQGGGGSNCHVVVSEKNRCISVTMVLCAIVL
jgi:hypothetical protein